MTLGLLIRSVTASNLSNCVAMRVSAGMRMSRGFSWVRLRYGRFWEELEYNTPRPPISALADWSSVLELQVTTTEGIRD